MSVSAPFGIPQDVWELLACPCDAHAALDIHVDESRLSCPVCGRSYEVRDGIPILLMEQGD